MRLRGLGPLCLSIGAALAFQDTSPFLVFSTSSHHFDSSTLNSHVQVARSDAITTSLASSIQEQGCLSDVYVLVAQQGVTASDFNVQTMPRLQNLFDQNANPNTNFVIRDVLGQVNLNEIAKAMQSKCGVTWGNSKDDLTKIEKGKPLVLSLDSKAPPEAVKDRMSYLGSQDTLIHDLIKAIGVSGHSYTLLFSTTPPSNNQYLEQESYLRQKNHDEAVAFDYEMEDGGLGSIMSGASYHGAMGGDLKRDLSSHLRRQDPDNDELSHRGLFEKYAFFSPGIFLGIFTFIILISILVVAIRAVAGLEVSYAAFSKEMGPAAQKKQQ